MRYSKKADAAIKYLLKNPNASAYQVSKASGVAWTTAKRMIEKRQTPAENIVVSPAVKPGGADVIQTAASTFKQRQKEYGDPAPHYADVAAMWSAILGVKVRPAQAAIMMLGLKLIRASRNELHLDSYIDIAGYAGVLWEVVNADKN